MTNFIGRRCADNNEHSEDKREATLTKRPI